MLLVQLCLVLFLHGYKRVVRLRLLAQTLFYQTLPQFTVNATDDRLISVNMVFDAAHGITAGNLFVQCFREVGDSFALLGADCNDGDSSGNITDIRG